MTELKKLIAKLLNKHKSNYTVETKEFTDGGLLCEVAPNKSANEVSTYIYTPKPIVQYGDTKARPPALNLKFVLEYLPLSSIHHEPGELTHHIQIIQESRFYDPKARGFNGKTIFSKSYDFLGKTNKFSNQIAILSFRGLINLVKNKTLREIASINFDNEIQFYRSQYLNKNEN